MKQLVWIFVACVCIGATGCGQKGPLVLPDKNAKVVTRPGKPKADPTATPSADAPPRAPAEAPKESANPAPQN